jgi:hypothetical protein
MEQIAYWVAISAFWSTLSLPTFLASQAATLKGLVASARAICSCFEN